MAKRFTDTEKYRKPFLRSLPGAYKLLWDYICNDCNHAGIWLVDFDIAQICVGKDMPVGKDKALRLFNEGEDRIFELENGKKWFIIPFIAFQYVKLSSTNPAHRNIIIELKKYGLIDENLDLLNSLKINDIQEPSKGLQSPFEGTLDIDKEKDKDIGSTGGKNESEKFKNFQKWITKNAPNVGKMKEPFTEDEYKRLLEDYSSEFVKELLLEMHNWKDLTKRNVNANLTFRNWAKRRKNE